MAQLLMIVEVFVAKRQTVDAPLEHLPELARTNRGDRLSVKQAATPSS
ncbi:MAG: hypothetical protein ABR907_07900 [Terracidiphilus sp.]